MVTLLNAAIEKLRMLPEEKQREFAELIMNEDGERYSPTLEEQKAINEGLDDAAAGRVYDAETVFNSMSARLSGNES